MENLTWFGSNMLKLLMIFWPIIFWGVFGHILPNTTKYVVNWSNHKSRQWKTNRLFSIYMCQYFLAVKIRLIHRMHFWAGKSLCCQKNHWTDSALLGKSSFEKVQDFQNPKKSDFANKQTMDSLLRGRLEKMGQITFSIQKYPCILILINSQFRELESRLTNHCKCFLVHWFKHL